MEKKNRDLSAEGLIKKLMANLGKDIKEASDSEPEQTTIREVFSEETTTERKKLKYHFKVERKSKINKDEGELSEKTEDITDDVAGYFRDVDKIADETISSYNNSETTSHIGTTTSNITHDDIQKSIKKAEEYISNLEKKAQTDELAAQKSVTEEKEFEFSFGDGNIQSKGAKNKKKSPLASAELSDINLMTIFGMDSVQSTDEAKTDETDFGLGGKGYTQTTERNFHSGYEYVSPEQNAEISNRFAAVYKNIFTRIAACALLLLVSLIIENLELFGIPRPAFISPTENSISYLLVGLVITLMCVGLTYKEVLYGFKSLFQKRPVPETMLSFLALSSVIYHFTLCFLDIGKGVPLFGLPVAFCAFLTLLYGLLNVKRRIYAFNVVSSKRDKFVLLKTKENKREILQSFGRNVSPDDAYGILRTRFVSDSFTRTRKKTKTSAYVSILIPVSIGISLLFFIVGYYVTKDIVSSLVLLQISLALIMPIASVSSMGYPHFIASKEAYSYEGAIIGDISFEEYADVPLVTFEDKYIFPPSLVKVKSIKMYGNSRIDKIMYKTASVLVKVGGTLADVFVRATKEFGQSENVEIINISSGGIEAVVDGTSVLMGNADFVKQHGYQPFRDGDDAALEYEGRLSIMYVIIGGEIASKIYIEYNCDPDFEGITKQLFKAGISVGVKTCDPNINNEMLWRKMNIARYAMRIIRCSKPATQVKAESNISSGVVSKHSAKSLLRIITLCEKVVYVAKTNLIVKLASLCIGTILTLTILLMGQITDISSLYVVVYQLFWIIPIIIITSIFV